jgi:hypothetical protein
MNGAAPVMTTPKSAHTGKRATGLTTLVLLALFGVIVLVVFSQRSTQESSPKQTTSSVPSESPSLPSPLPPVRHAPLVDTQVTIKEDYFYSSVIDLHRDALVGVSIDVLGGPEIETWTLNEAGFRKFEEAGKSFLGREFTHYPDLRMINARRETKSVRLRKGRYYVVFDNTDQGDTKPPANLADDSAEVHIRITAE